MGPRGSTISRSGLAKRELTEAAWEETGERARRFVGRFERRSWEVGIDSGIGSDICVWKVSGVLFRWSFVGAGKGNRTKRLLLRRRDEGAGRLGA